MMKLFRLSGPFALLIVCAVHSHEAQCDEFQEIPNNEQIIETRELVRLAGNNRTVQYLLAGSRWPSERAMRKLRPPEKDVPPVARQKIAGWIRRVLAGRLVPPDLEARLIPLRGYMNNHDYFAVRYTVKGKKVQILCGIFLYCLISDDSLLQQRDSLTRQMDLGARNYLNYPKGLVAPQEYNAFGIRKPVPKEVAPGLWIGHLGCPANPSTSYNWEVTWYEDSACLLWDQHLLIGAKRWQSYHGLHGVPIRGSDQDPYHPVNPDWQDFSTDKYYVLFNRHPNWWVILTTAFLVMVGFGCLSMLKNRNKRRGSATEASRTKQ